MTQAIPYLTCRNAPEAIEFYARAFGAKIGPVMKGPDGKVLHASLDIDGGTVYLSDEFPDFGALSPLGHGGSSVTIHLQVEDADPVWARAIEAGCTATMPLALQFWGDKYGNLVDPYGHNWGICQMIEVRTPEQIHAAMMEAGPEGSPS